MRRIFVLFAALTGILFSCKKHYYNETRIIPAGSPIAGAWDFKSMDVQTQGSNEIKIGTLNQKTEATLNYISENNDGRLMITDSVITAIGLTYTISSSIKTYNYKNGVLTDSSETPYNISFYEPQSVCTYKMIGDDSVSFPKGGFTNISASTLRTDPLAAKISFKGDTLIFKESIYKDTTVVKLGTVYHTIQTGTAVMNVVKHK